MRDRVRVPFSPSSSKLNRRDGNPHRHSRWPAAALLRLRLTGALDVDAAVAPLIAADLDAIIAVVQLLEEVRVQAWGGGGRPLQLQGKDTELDNGHSLGKKQIDIAEQWGEKLLLS